LKLVDFAERVGAPVEFGMFIPARRFTTLLDLSLISVLIVASFVTVLRIALAPVDAAAGIAVIYAPWTTADQTMLRAVSAGARFVRFGGFDFIAVVVPERANYVQRALAGAALLVVDPRVLSACTSGSYSPSGPLP
jgi:hypothetical protein